MMVVSNSQSKNLKYFLVILALFSASLFLAGCKALNPPMSTPSPPPKSSHFESSTPIDQSVLAGVPINIVVDFNLDLAAGSEISINLFGKDYSTGQTAIDENKLTIRRAMDPTAPDGLYRVAYKACFADSSCENGEFFFTIDKSKAAGFVDMRGQKEVTINLANIAFAPREIRISRGTKVTWTNTEDVEHYINTDAHPSHTYELLQNSAVLKKGDKYTYPFEKLGIYPYHCSAHANSMTGSILVE